MAKRRFQHEDAEILGSAYENNYREPNGTRWPSDSYLQVELMVDIRNLLYELNQSFAKLANPIMIAQDAALEKVDNSKINAASTIKATNAK